MLHLLILCARFAIGLKRNHNVSLIADFAFPNGKRCYIYIFNGMLQGGAHTLGQFQVTAESNLIDANVHIELFLDVFICEG